MIYMRVDYDFMNYPWVEYSNISGNPNDTEEKTNYSSWKKVNVELNVETKSGYTFFHNIGKCDWITIRLSDISDLFNIPKNLRTTIILKKLNIGLWCIW